VRIAHEIILSVSLLVLAGCASKPITTLRGDTALEMQSSIQMVRANMMPDRREAFDRAVATIVFSATDRRFTQGGDRLTPQSIKMLRGLNANQVIETAKLLRTVSATY
jgi:hypothetical protein